MSGFDWNVAAVGASAAAIAALVTVARGVRRRRRRQTDARTPQLGERRIEVVAIDDGRSIPKRDPYA